MYQNNGLLASSLFIILIAFHPLFRLSAAHLPDMDGRARGIHSHFCAPKSHHLAQLPEPVIETTAEWLATSLPFPGLIWANARRSPLLVVRIGAAMPSRAHGRRTSDHDARAAPAFWTKNR
jgi:hypothetical protein